MPVTFVKGDFINERPKGKPRAYACPVDVLGATDSGIAAAVAKRWPGFGEWWSQQRKQIGDVAVFEAAEGDLVFALVVQRGGKRGKLGWLDRAVRAMLAEAAKREVTHINVPRLWGGASGLDGARAKRIIDDAALAVPVEVVVFEQFIRASGVVDAPASEPAPASAPALASAPASAASPKKKSATAKKKSAAAPKKKKSAAAASKKKSAVAAPKKKSAAAPKKKAAAKKKATAKKKTSRA